MKYFYLFENFLIIKNLFDYYEHYKNIAHDKFYI